MKVKVRILPAPLLLQFVLFVIGSRGLAMFGALYMRPAYANDKGVIAHKLAHIEQVERHGSLGFVFRYMWYFLRYGPTGNPFEVEARAAEAKADIRLYR